MGKKQREERKTRIQEARQSPISSGVATPSNRPTDRATIRQIVDSHHDRALEQHLPDISSSRPECFFGQARGNINNEGEPAVTNSKDSASKQLYKDEYLEREYGGPNNSKTPEEEAETRKSRRWAYKNVYGLNVAYVMLYTAFIGLQSLQSSINSAGGLGLVTLSIMYGVYFAGGFVTPGFLKLFGTKYSLLFGFVCHLIYTLTNYYPSWYTLVPGSILIGFAFAPTWAAVSTHLAEVAIAVAPSLHKNQDYLITKFTGIFFFVFQFSRLPGNLASSLILFPYSEESTSDFADNLNVSIDNLTDLEDEVCHLLDNATFDVKFLYILVSVYVGFMMMSIAILLAFVDKLPTSNSFFSAEKKFELYLKKPLIDLLKVLKDVKMVLIAPMVVFNGMELAFAFGSFTEHYISQCFGTYQVGFTLIAFGLSSSIMSIVYSRCLKCLPRFLVILFGVFLSSSMLLFMLFWERGPSYYAIFGMALGWGAADALWNTMPASLTGILFASDTGVAYSALRIWQAIGFTVGFAMAELFSFHIRLWLLLGTLVLTAVCNLILELTTQSKEELLPCVYHKHQPKSCDNGELYDSKEDEPSSESCSTKMGQDMTIEYDLTQHPNGIGQNPIFILYQGRRPSMISNCSADSFDGSVLLSSTTSGILPNGQNPIFLMHQGRRPSVISMYSADSLDGTMPLTGRRPSMGSLAIDDERKASGITSFSRDSLNGMLSVLSSGSTSLQGHPPLIISTVVCVSEDPGVRVLSPIDECADESYTPVWVSDSTRKVSIQRSDSYMAALNSVTDYTHNLTS